jgi:hypothetical protein
MSLSFRKLYPWILGSLGCCISYYFTFGEPLVFHNAGLGEGGGKLYEASFERNNQTFVLTRLSGETNWNLTSYTLSVLKDSKIHQLGTYTTCGRFKLDTHQIKFFSTNMACGLITGTLNNFSPIYLEIIEFKNLTYRCVDQSNISDGSKCKSN